MSAKKASPKARQPVPATAATAPSAAASSADAGTSWLDSSNPRHRAIGKAVFYGIWIYVGALWLLALDQWFNWGIFGPKIPPLP